MMSYEHAFDNPKWIMDYDVSSTTALLKTLHYWDKLNAIALP